MSTLTHPPTAVTSGRQRWSERVVAEVWGALAIVAMWLAVAVSAVWGPDLVATAGSSTTTIPSGMVVSLCALVGTWVVARNAFGRRDDRAD